jgi:NADH:ubiquinone oxidoreductase subunit 3 (subunit A)
MNFQAYAIISGFFILAGLVVGLIGWGLYRGILRKGEAHEEGFPSEQTEAQNFNPRLILYGALFSILSISLLFLFPWAFSFEIIGVNGFLIVLFFLMLLGIALFYSWKKETLERN